MRLNPFRALRPPPEFAAQVACVPYDVVNREEAASLAAGNPRSFLHVGRPDIDLPAGTDPYDAACMPRAARRWRASCATGRCCAMPTRTVYIYRQEMDGRGQTGVVASVHVDDYEHNVIRKHEKTRKDKEDDRTRHVLTLDANAEPVFLAYRPSAAINADVAAAVKAPALYDFVAPDGVRHIVWKVTDPSPLLRALRRGAAGLRGRRASSLGERLARGPGAARGEPAPHRRRGVQLVPGGAVPVGPAGDPALQPGGEDAQRTHARGVPREAGGAGAARAGEGPAPRAARGRSRSSSRARGGSSRWTRRRIDRGDPIGSLDVSLLQDRVLGPILGITDPRTDKRIDFVGGIRGAAELERRVTSGEMALGISMFPTTMDQLLAVSDAGEIMPPKSTWFEPKLRSGLFVHELRRGG